MTSAPTVEQVTQALGKVLDPDIRRPITELGMVKDVAVAPGGAVRVDVWLTVAGCPLKDKITKDVTDAVAGVPGVSGVRVELDVMSDDQRRDLQSQLRGGKPAPEIPFAKPSSLTRVYAVASGKGGVGKSSVTVNLAAALAASGRNVGVVDADIYGHSVPRMLGVTGRPTQRVNSAIVTVRLSAGRCTGTIRCTSSFRRRMLSTRLTVYGLAGFGAVAVCGCGL